MKTISIFIIIYLFRITKIIPLNAPVANLSCPCYVIIRRLFSYPLLRTIGRSGSVFHTPSTINLICINCREINSQNAFYNKNTLRSYSIKQKLTYLIFAWIQLQTHRKNTWTWFLHLPLQGKSYFNNNNKKQKHHTEIAVQASRDLHTVF